MTRPRQTSWLLSVLSPVIVVVVALLLPVLPAYAADVDPADPVSPPAPTASPEPAYTATPPGPRSVVVRNLRRALRAADQGRAIPPDARPGRVDLVGDTRTLPPECTAEPGEDRHRVCVRGRTRSPYTVVVLGNSHMAMWLAGLEERARQAGVRVVPFIKYGCAPYSFEMWRNGRPWPECSSWRDWAVRKVRRMKPDLVITAAHTWLEMQGPNGGQLPKGRLWNRQWRDGVSDLARRLAPRAGRVVVLGDTLTRRDHPAECARQPGAGMRSCEVRMTNRTRQLLRLTRRGARAGGAEYLDMNAFTCLDGRCPVVAGGSYVFRDKFGHLTATYSRQVSGAFAKAVGLRR